MAGEKLTAGIKLGYGSSTDGVAIPATWSYIPNITSTPDLDAAPDTVDVTDLSDMVYKRAIQGLIDLSTLEFEANYTDALATAVTAASAAQTAPAKMGFTIDFPQFAKRFWFFGTIQSALPAGAAVGDVVTCKLTVFVNSPITIATIAA